METDQNQIATKTQEVTFLTTSLGSIAVLIMGLVYLLSSPEHLITLVGGFGSDLARSIFSLLGYNTFFLGFSLYWLGRFLCKIISEPSDFKNKYKPIVSFLLFQLFLIIFISSLLTIFQNYFGFHVHSVVLKGAGGLLGYFFGFKLYSLFGIYGSLMILFVLVNIVGIISDQYSLVSGMNFTKSFIKRRVQSLSVNPMNKISPYFENNIFVQKIIFKFNRIFFKTNKDNQNGTEKENQNSLDYKNISGEISLDTSTSANLEFSSFHTGLDFDISELKNKKNTTKKGASKKAKEPKTDLPEEPKAEVQEEIIEQFISYKPWKKRYTKPNLKILNKPTKALKLTQKEIDEKKALLETHLESFQITGEVIDIHVGATLTMYEYQPKAGVKLSKISGLTDDLAMALGASSIRILAPIPGKTTIGVEIPNEQKRVINLSELIKVKDSESSGKLSFPVGMDVYNQPIISDLAKMPHLLVSGTTGSGKSVFINILISSLLFKLSPKELRFIMIDPKMIELSPYNGIPHLLKPVVTDTNEAKACLQWAEKEMDRRYKMLSVLGSKDITSFNEKISTETAGKYEKKLKKKLDFDWAPMPYLVVIIDELADLMMTQGKEVEIPITRIAQKARACGIHMVIATQRPSSDIITGLIKTNFPSRVACKVSSGIDSRTILDTSGAERLFGYGDLLFLPNGKSISRLQSAFISEKEVKKLVNDVSKNK